jgi:hypothetical protein
MVSIRLFTQPVASIQLSSPVETKSGTPNSANEGRQLKSAGWKLCKITITRHIYVEYVWTGQVSVAFKY